MVHQSLLVAIAGVLLVSGGLLLADACCASNAAAQSEKPACCAAPAATAAAKPESAACCAVQPAAKPASALDFAAKTIDGKEVHLAQYKGKVVLIVNTASKCGLTPQYAELEKLYRANKDKGLVVLAFPCNDFGNQEPGTEQQIQQFCTSNYEVSFDLFSKVAVKGDGQSPLYQYLTSQETNPDFGGEIKWNFTKFLVSRDGKIIGRFEPRTKPSETQVVEAIQKELEKKAS